MVVISFAFNRLKRSKQKGSNQLAKQPKLPSTKGSKKRIVSEGKDITSKFS